MTYRSRIRTLLIALLLLPGAAPLLAQDLDAACEAIAGSTIGAWTEHAITSANGELDVRFALVSDRGATWYEIQSQTPAGRSILQLRVPGFPFRPAEIEEVISKTGTTPAMRLPRDFVEQYRASAQHEPLSDLRAQCAKAEVLGHEEISVAGGTFQTTHLRFPSSGGEVWVSAAVPFGIVRGNIPGQGTTELKAHGTGAVSSITETPISLDGAGGASSDTDP